MLLYYRCRRILVNLTTVQRLAIMGSTIETDTIRVHVHELEWLLRLLDSTFFSLQPLLFKL